MNQQPSRFVFRRPLLTWLSILLLGAACHGTGHVREAPSVSFPAESPAEAPAEAAGASEPQRGGAAPRFATPPGDDTALGHPGERSHGHSGPNKPEPSIESGSAAAASPPRAEAKGQENWSGTGDRSADELGWQPRSGRGGDSARRSVAEERPGLATHWGEDRYSPAREVEFERAEPRHPSTLVELRYDDREGARRMLPEGSWGRAERRLPSGITVRVVDSTGQTLPALARGARVVAVGTPGERYALAIENNTSRRFEVVASVDGLDVLDGQAARVDKRGYLVAAYSSVSIDGFRRSNDEVAAFRLGNVAHSYAASKGQSNNVGVIGFAFFDERRLPALEPAEHGSRPTSEDTRLRRRADPFPGDYARPPVW